MFFLTVFLCCGLQVTHQWYRAPPKCVLIGKRTVTLKILSSHLVPYMHWKVLQELHCSAKRRQTTPLVPALRPDCFSVTQTRRALHQHVTSLWSIRGQASEKTAMGSLCCLDGMEVIRLIMWQLSAVDGLRISHYCVFRSVRWWLEVITALILTTPLFPWGQWTPSTRKTSIHGLELDR